MGDNMQSGIPVHETIAFPAYVLVRLGDHLANSVMDLSSKSSLLPVTSRGRSPDLECVAWFTNSVAAIAYSRNLRLDAQAVPIENAYQATAFLGTHPYQAVVVDPIDDNDASCVCDFQAFCDQAYRLTGILQRKQPRNRGESFLS